MRTIILSPGLFRPVAGRLRAFEALSAAKCLGPLFGGILRFSGCDWRRLNARALADIGETPATAERARLGDPLETPLGLVGGGVDVDGRPLLARRTSPLG
ncbi:MAG: hypothetical protein JO288_00610 [Hyphomicrobiales bacterium]|nr:hypothetical protein [Hyphomicrobiales bacterium]